MIFLLHFYCCPLHFPQSLFQTNSEILTLLPLLISISAVVPSLQRKQKLWEFTSASRNLSVSRPFLSSFFQYLTLLLPSFLLSHNVHFFWKTSSTSYMQHPSIPQSTEIRIPLPFDFTNISVDGIVTHVHQTPQVLLSPLSQTHPAYLWEADIL